jgi:ABC-type phosphate transport system substrate-binding protein
MKNILKAITTLVMVLSFSSFAEVSVIVNKDNLDAMSSKVIKRIYLGKSKSFPNGSKVNVLTLKGDTDETEVFNKSALKKTNSQFKAYWSKLVFTGKGIPPKEMADAEAMLSEIKTDKNAIGYIDSNKVTEDVRVIVTY